MAPPKPLQALRTAIIFEQRSHYMLLGHSPSQLADLPHLGEIQCIWNALDRLGCHVILIPGIESLVDHLARGRWRDWDLVFNMASGFRGSAREAQVPGLLEAYGVLYTGSDAKTLGLCLDKALTKIVLQHHKIPTAPFFTIAPDIPVSDLEEYSTILPEYPLFIKPVAEGMSRGITAQNKIAVPTQFVPALASLRSECPTQDILVEPFLGGREFSVTILGTGDESHVLGIAEEPIGGHAESNTVDFLTCEAKTVGEADEWGIEDTRIALESDDEHVKTAGDIAMRTWRALRCRDIGRVDVRFDSKNQTCFVMEVNPIVGLLENYSTVPVIAAANGMQYDELMLDIVQSAMKRNQGGKSNEIGETGRKTD